MDLKQAEIGLLIALDILLDTESVTASAKRLGISQPAMSAQLARLRTLFNDPLLIASGRRLMPTTRALALREPLKRLLGDLGALVRESVHFAPERTETTFRLIGTDYVHAVVAPSLMAAIARKAPKARLALLPFEPRAVWGSLKDGIADAALVTGMTLPAARMRHGLSEDFLAIRRRVRSRSAPKLTLDAFCEASHILVSPEGGGFVGVIDGILKTIGRQRRVAYSLPSFLLAPPIVAQTEMICVLPRRLAALCPDNVESCELPFPSPAHPRRQNDPAHRWFRREIMAAVKAL